MNTSFLVHGVAYYEGDDAHVFSMESTERWVPDAAVFEDLLRQSRGRTSHRDAGRTY